MAVRATSSRALRFSRIKSLHFPFIVMINSCYNLGYFMISRAPKNHTLSPPSMKTKTPCLKTEPCLITHYSSTDPFPWKCRLRTWTTIRARRRRAPLVCFRRYACVRTVVSVWVPLMWEVLKWHCLRIKSRKMRATMDFSNIKLRNAAKESMNRSANMWVTELTLSWRVPWFKPPLL